MISTIVTCLLIAASLQVSAAQIEPDTKKQARAYPMSVLRPVGFNYLIYADELVSPEQPLLCSRNVYVLMEEDAFSEASVRELFAALSEAFPKPKSLSVMVRTSLEQVRPIDPPDGRGRILCGESEGAVRAFVEEVQRTGLDDRLCLHSCKPA